MAYWLMKTEPNEYSYSDLEQEGTTVWNGVKNALALKHLRNMSSGDLVFIYHTGKERQIIGLAEVVSQPYPDPMLNDSKRVVVDIRVMERISQPLTLKKIKGSNLFGEFDLLRLPRLSVLPVPESYWNLILKLAKTNN
ncbi:MAG: EVE domain-containing protein [Mastigocoleus sp. MO_167.B18]|uniref:EVE domain-containing protein n=1 Tax=Mastigocoleus sp. MO_188.B34 TaxID=3036635 RepID=UPI002610432B|nr:EVE domain-containing protein [Mastigocoleus sp. MO_188.B34]MDJ0697083.1 EVE domain-containing protein [Mastigocoleus sp. MO_188.B34]MDJ0774234.1 EVE domain-containing protein [Mastigocoleus sp. MO_167.B18]